MKNKTHLLSLLVYLSSLFSNSLLYGLGEKTLSIGAASGWGAVESLEGVTAVQSVRPYAVLALSSIRRTAEGPGAGGSPQRENGVLDMALSFDEGLPERFADQTGHYTVSADASVSAAAQRWARAGTGAAHFAGAGTADAQRGLRGDAGPLVITPRDDQALFSRNRGFGDFTLEFWLYPMHLENGGQILFWSSTRMSVQGKHITERIQCVAAKDRLQWTFLDFFSAPDDSRQLTVSFTGLSPVTPKTWSHHLVRFDSRRGFLEYLVDGKGESISYTTSSGREGGEVFTPKAGDGGRLVLGGRYTGLMDEFRIFGSFIDPELERYRRGGRFETRLLDLGESNSRIVRIDAFGGRIAVAGDRQGRRAWGPELPNGNFSFTDDSAVQFFIRAGDSPYIRIDGEWQTFKPGMELSAEADSRFRGRYVQVAAEFYPSGDGEMTPYLDELRIIYIPDDPPAPPALLTAAARDGGVELSWKSSSGKDTAGYLVYYGTAKGEFFGNDAILGVSPIDVGRRTTVRIDGLKNGVLYYFAVAAYDRPHHGGEFSREVTARPLRMIE
ncbi:MAG: hypothetical protein LBD37_03860 [Treponema sp.]|jgi:hypothetical protein|nr:hypothetical protein [Treponema sp.]